MTAQRALVAMAVVGAVVAMAGCGRQPKAEVVARVGNHQITDRDLFRALDQQDNGDAGRRALDAVILRHLLRDEAEKRGLKADPKEVARRIEGVKDYVLASTGKNWEAWLKDTGQTEEDITDRVSLQVLTAKLVLSNAEKERYFEQNKERLKDLPHLNESVIWRQIVVGTKAEAEAVRKELLQGAGDKAVTPVQFAKVAQERSLDPMTRSRGGMVGWQVKGKSPGPGMADAELEKALFALKPGEVSEPLQVKVQMPEGSGGQTPERWRVVMVDKHLKPRPLTLAENGDVIEDYMLNDPAYQFQVQQFFDNLRAKANVEVLAPRYRAIEEAYRQRKEMRDQRMEQPMAPPLSSGAVPQPAPRAGGRRPGG